ncbi:MAG: lysophospholipid acyltransferase family protein [Acetobacteraceae bacterium]|nr:lysophospholipid acyltransferase family protein [Acetobacteraceae bacterium]
MTLSRRSPPLDRSAASTQGLPPGTVTEQRLRCARRIILAALWTVPCAIVQAVLLQLPGDGKRRLARRYWAGISRILGVERRVIGAAYAGARPVLFACNHTSWLDVPALGGTLEACFVAKAEVGTWPVVRTIALLGRTVFVSRKASETGRERDAMRARLNDGDDLILFPEGTSSDGSRVLPFRSPFFAVVEASPGNLPPLIQPVSIVYDRLDYLPARRSTRPVSSWYGDMDLGSHFWSLARHRHLRASILLHEPIDPAGYPNRKAVAQAVWGVIAAGNAALRQGRS